MPSVTPKQYLEAAKNGDLNSVLHYLSEHKHSKAYLNIKTGSEYDELRGHNALALAAYYNQEEIAIRLLLAGIGEKKWALYFAAKKGHVAIARLLVAKVSDKQFALEAAASKGSIEIVSILLANIYDPKVLRGTCYYNFEDRKEDRIEKFEGAEEIAQKNGHYDCATLIRVRKKELENWRFRFKFFNKPSSFQPANLSTPSAPSAPPKYEDINNDTTETFVKAQPRALDEEIHPALQRDISWFL